MKKIIWIIILLFTFLFSSHIASEKWDQNEFTKEMKQYGSELFPELSNDEWVNDLLKREYEYK